MTTPDTPENDNFEPVTDPSDPAYKQRRILESIARKQAKAPAVDNQGQPIPGKLRWGGQR
jgi:hypothetical protein